MVPAERFLRRAAELDLTDEQVAGLEKLAHDTKTKLIDLRAEMAKERMELQRLRRSDSDDIAQFRKHFNAIAKIRVQIQETRLVNRIEARKALTEEQRQTLEEKGPRRRAIRD
jgi:Spy/CpxP family protein refolding chaperone